MLKLASFPALQRIRLNKVLRLTDKAFENLAKSKTVKTISLSKNRNITGVGLASLAGNKTLVQLHLQELEKLSAKGLGGIGRLEALEDLRIENDEKFWTRAHIMALRDLPKIKSIRLVGISDSDENLYQDVVNSLPMYDQPYEDEFFEQDEE